jgi:hypothetical protein
VFAVAEVDFLGHRVSTAGISPLPKHVEALQRLPVPTGSWASLIFIADFYLE